MADKFKIQGDITFRHDPPSLDAEVKKIKAKLAGIFSVKDILKIEISKDTSANISSLNSKLKETLTLVQQIALNSEAINRNFQSLNKVRPGSGLSGVKEKVSRQAVSVGESTVEGVEQGLQKAKPKIVSLVDTFLGGVQVRFSQFLKFAVAAFIVDQARTAFNTGFEAVLKIDDAQNKLRQITGESKENVADLGREIANLGKQLGTSTTGLAKVSETIAQAGFSLSQTRDIVKEIALTELAPSFGNLDETTDALIAVTEQFELIDKSAKKAPAIGKYFDIVNRLSKEYAVEAKDLSEATKLAGASFAAASDIEPGDINRNLDEFRKLASLITVIRSQTRISAPQIGTGIKTLSTRLQNINIQDELNSIFGEDLGLRDAEGQFIGVLESFSRIEEALDRLGDKGKGTSEVFAKVTQALGGDRQAKILPAILQRTAEVYDVLSNARKNDNSVLEDSILAQERVSIKLAKINREIISFAVGVAESSGFKQFLDYLYEITKAALNVADALKPLIPLVNTLVLANVATYAGRKLQRSFQRVDQDLLAKVKRGPSAYLGASASGSRRATVSDEDYNFFNRGGYVNALVTPGEEIFSPEQVSRIGQSKLASYNYAGSRTGINERGMIVPGHGNSDSVPMQLPHGSFVVRKNSVQKFSDIVNNNLVGGLAGRSGMALLNSYSNLGIPINDEENTVRLIHRTSNINNLNKGQNFRYSTTLNATTDSYGHNNNVAFMNNLDTAKAGAFSRRKFGDKIVIMQMSDDEYRNHINNALGYVENKKILGIIGPDGNFSNNSNYSNKSGKYNKKHIRRKGLSNKGSFLNLPGTRYPKTMHVPGPNSSDLDVFNNGGSVKRFASGGSVGFQKFAGGSKFPKYKEGPIPQSIYSLSKILSDIFGIAITGMQKVKEQIPEGAYRAKQNKIMVRSDLSKDAALPNLAHELVHALGIDKEDLISGITGESIKREYARKAEEKGISRTPEQLNKEVNATLFGDYVKNNPNIKSKIEDIYKTLLNPKLIEQEAEKLAKYASSLDPTINVNQEKTRFIESQTQARKAQAAAQISELVRQGIISQGQGNKGSGEYLKFGTGYGAPGSRIPAEPGLVQLTSSIPKKKDALSAIYNPRKIGEAIYRELIKGNKTAKERFEADPNLYNRIGFDDRSRLKLLYEEAKQERRALIQKGGDPTKIETTKQIFQRKAISDLQGASNADDSDIKRSVRQQEYLELRRSTLVGGVKDQRNSAAPLVFLNKTMKEQADKMIDDIRKEAKKPSFIQRFRENLFLPVSTGFFGKPQNTSTGSTVSGDPNDQFSAFRVAQSDQLTKEQAAKAAYKADRKLLNRQRAGNIASGAQSVGLTGGVFSGILLQSDKSDAGQTFYSGTLGASAGAAAGAGIGYISGPYGALAGAIGGAAIGGFTSYQAASSEIAARKEFNKISALENVNSSLLERGNIEDEKEILQNVFKIGRSRSKGTLLERGDNLKGTRFFGDIGIFLSNPFNGGENIRKAKEARLKIQKEELGSFTTGGIVDVLKSTADRDLKNLVASNDFGIDNIDRISDKLRDAKLLRETSIREGSRDVSDVDPLLLYNQSKDLRRSITGSKEFSRLVFSDTYSQLSDKEKKKVDENILKNKKGIEAGTYNYLDAFSGSSRAEDIRDKTEESILKNVIDIKKRKKEENNYQKIASELDSFVQAQIQKANVLRSTSELFDFSISKINDEISSVRTGQLSNFRGPDSIIAKNIKGSNIQDIRGLSKTVPGFEKDINSIASAESLRRNFLSDYEADKSDSSSTKKIQNIIKNYIPSGEDNKFITNEIQKIFSDNLDEETNISNVRASKIDQLLTTYVDNLSEPLKVALELRDKALENLSSGINEIASKRIEQRKLQTAGNASFFNADRRLAQIRGTEIFTAGDEYKKQLNTVLGTQDFRLDPQRLFDNIEQNQSRISQLKNDPQILTNKKLQDELKDLTTATTAGVQALDMLTDRSAELSDVFNKLERDQKRISGSRDILLGGIYGGRKAQEETRRSFDLLKRLEAGVLDVSNLGEKDRNRLRSGIEDLKKISPEAAGKAENKLLETFGKVNGLTGANIALPFGAGNLNFDRIAANKLDQNLLNQKNELLAKENQAINLKNQLIDKELALLEKRIALNPDDPLGTNKVANKQVSGHISIGGLVDVKVNLDEQESLKNSIEQIIDAKIVNSINAFANNNGMRGV